MSIVGSTRKTLFLRAAVAGLLAGPVSSFAAKPEPATKPSEREARLAAAREARLDGEIADVYRTAETTYLIGDFNRAGELFQRVITVGQGSSLIVRAHTRLGDCAFQAKRFDDAMQAYRRAALMADAASNVDEKAAGVRADYMVGRSAFAARQYTQAFGQLRRFIDRHPGDALINQAYQAIGDAHLALEQYQQALAAYRMVGTVLSEKTSAHHHITPGQRLYLRVTDADVNIGDTPKTVFATIKTTNGDVETVELQPLGLRSPVFIGSIPTVLGPPRHSDDLVAIFSAARESSLRDQLDEAERLKTQAAEKTKDAEKLGQAGAADPAGTEKQRAAATAAAEQLNKQAQAVIATAGKTVDEAYAATEKLVAQWSPQQSLEAIRSRKPTTSPSTAPAVAQAAGAGADAGVPTVNLGPLPENDAGPTTRTSLADDDLAPTNAAAPQSEEARRTMDQAHIDAIRLDVAKDPTSAATIDKRLMALTVWSKSLHRQFQRLELLGGDKIEISYTDEIGPNGPNETGKAIRRDTLDVASDAQLSLLTPDGKQQLEQAVLGGDIVLRVADVDRDVSNGADQITITLAGISAGDHVAAAVPTTAPSTQSSTPGDVPAATTIAQPLKSPLLKPSGAEAVTVTLGETGPHTGVFERQVHLDAGGITVDGKTLPLAAGKFLRAAYRDEHAVRHDDNWVIVQEAELIGDKGGAVAAVRYQQSQLDLEAKLGRAVSAGEMGKIYLDLGLTKRGKDYLSNAQRDCAEVANSATKSTLGEKALYHSWRIYFYAGLLDDAVGAAHTLIDKYPLSEYAPDAMLQIGQVSLERGEKLVEQEKAAGEKPSFNGDLHRAVSQLDALVGKYGRSTQAPEALFLIGRAKIAAGQSGIDSFERLAKQYPDSGFAARGLIKAANYYVGVGDFRRAQEYYSRILVDYPDSPDMGSVLLNRGICQYKLSQFAEATATLYQVLEEHSGTDLAHDAQKYINFINQKRGEKQ